MKKLITISILLLVCGLAKAEFSGGSGTLGDPYQISTAGDMALIATNVNAGSNPNDYSGKYFKLMNDISLPTSPDWTPIGNSSSEFRGIFDGNFKKITGLTISGTSDYCGLFGNIGYGCSIKNLTIETCSITTTGSYVGALAGKAYLNTANQNITIDNCKASGNITAQHDRGGLIGYVLQTSQSTGGDAYSIIISNSSSSVNVVSSDDTKLYAGGLVGNFRGESASTKRPQLQYSYATGNVSTGNLIGGLVGESVYSIISNCYATGSVSRSPNQYAGGLIGDDGYSIISNCYSKGSVTAGSSTNLGFIGQSDGSTITNCFWDINTSGQSTSYGGGIGKTTTQMTTQSTFTGWDFTSPIWLIDASHNSNYPYLNATPTITSFSPISGAVGAAVTITGNNFNITPDNNVVFFGATRATVSAASATSLTVNVPSGATYAPITVLNTGTTLAAYSMANFTPTFSPNKGSISTGDFAAKVDFATYGGPNSVAIGDIDGDGKPDLVIANYNNNVSVLRNISSSGSISFETKVDLVVNSNLTSIAIGDIDGDGKPDLVTTNYGSNSVSVLHNISNGSTISFDTKADYTTGSGPQSVAIGDIDGDGKPDLAVANYGSSTVSVLLNKGSYGYISFDTHVDFATGGNPSSIAIGDIDGDGKPDLVTANYGTSKVSVLRNTSSGIGNINFDTKADYTTGSGPQSVAIGDIDGDGKPDLVTANYLSNSVSVLHNISSSGTISFATKADHTTGSGPYSVAIGDIDGDCKPDLAVANYDTNKVSVLRNTSSGIGNINFADKVDLTTTGNPQSVAIGDINGDGKPDLAVANYPSNNVSVLRNLRLNTWTGATNTDWATAGNWNTNAIPIASDDVTIPSGQNPVISATTHADCHDLTVASGGTLTIASTASGTGSLIVSGTSTGNVICQNYIIGSKWHIISPAAAGLDILTFVQASGNAIKTKLVSSTNNYSMMDYGESSNTWNIYFTTATSAAFSSGQGYSVQRTDDGIVTFTGTLTSGTKTVALTKSGAGWNCIGNPYTSAINMNTAAGSNNFLATNNSKLDASYACMYLWDDDSKSYKILGNVNYGGRDLLQNNLQSGQGFFVKAKDNGLTVQFNTNMQVHQPTTAFKSGQASWPGLELTATTALQAKASTVVTFNDAMTKGLDPSYDAGLLRGSSGISIYTRLVEDNGIDFAIQCLPVSGYQNFIIPVGIDYATGGEVTISLQSTSLPLGMNVILEDRLNKTFTALTTGSELKITVDPNTKGIGRFYLRTTALSVNDLKTVALPGKLNAYVSSNSEIRIIGEISSKAIATLYDTQGKAILSQNLKESNLNVIPTSNIKTGIYMLSVRDTGKLQSFKLFIKQ